MSTITELRARHETLATEARTMIEGAESEDRGFNDAEDARYAEISRVLDQIAARAARIKESEERASALREFEALVEEARSGDPEFAEVLDLDKFFRGDRSISSVDVAPRRPALARRAEEGRATTTVGTANTPPDGTVKELVGETVYNQVMTAITQVGGVLPAATVVTHGKGDPWAIPSVAAITADGAAEGAALTAQNLDSDKRTLAAYKVGALVEMSSESLTDTMFDLVALTAQLGGEAIGTKTNAWFATGTGTNQPTGIYSSVTTGPAAVAAINYDALVDVEASVPTRAMVNGSWLLSKAAYVAVRKIKDSSGLPLWMPNIALGEPSTLLAHPVYLDDFGPAVTTGNKPVVFGDLRSYWVRWVGGIRFERSDHAAFGSDKVQFRILTRVDGKFGRTDLVRALEIS